METMTAQVSTVKMKTMKMRHDGDILLIPDF
jgi:hypothetical protein